MAPKKKSSGQSFIRLTDREKAQKKKALRKKKIEREKKKREEEKRRIDAANELRERILMYQAERESKLYEQELINEILEQGRRREESEKIEAVERARADEYAKWKKRMTDRQQWTKYVEHGHKIDASNEAEMNSYITEWLETSVPTQFNESALAETLGHCMGAEELIIEIKSCLSQAFEEKNEKLSARHEGFIARLREISMDKLNHLTAHIIQHADIFAKETSDPTVTEETPNCKVAYCVPNIKLGISVNLSKNPMNKDINFTELGLRAEMPTELALANIGLRLLQTTFDVLTPAGSDFEYLPCGGIVYLQLLQMPAPSKTVKGWTLRPVTHQSTSVHSLPYVPPKPKKGSTLVPALKLSFQFDQVCLPPKFDGETARIAYWDAALKQWAYDQISNFTWDPRSSMISFETFHAAPHSIVFKRHIAYPFRSWSLVSTGRNRVIFTIVTAQGLEIQIEIFEDSCTLRKPYWLKLPSIYGRMKPFLLLQELQRIGINIISDEAYLKFLTKAEDEQPITLKDISLEEKIHHQMGQVVGGFAFASSKWNQGATSHRVLLNVANTQEISLEKDFLFNDYPNPYELPNESKEGEDQKDEKNQDYNHDHNHKEDSQSSEHPCIITDSPPAMAILHEHKWEMLLVHEKSCIFIKAKESDTQYNGEPLPNIKDHHHLFYGVISHPRSTPKAEKEIKVSKESFARNVAYVLDIIRPLSFTR